MKDVFESESFDRLPRPLPPGKEWDRLRRHEPLFRALEVYRPDYVDDLLHFNIQFSPHCRPGECSLSAMWKPPTISKQYGRSESAPPCCQHRDAESQTETPLPASREMEIQCDLGPGIAESPNVPPMETELRSSSSGALDSCEEAMEVEESTTLQSP